MDIPIYIINLKHRKKRLFLTLHELQKLDLFNNIIIHKATDKEKAKEEKFKYITKVANNNIENNLTSLNIIPTWGAVGCAISHINCWEDIKKKNFSYAIICEDDIKINDIESFKYSLNKAMRLINTNNPIFITFNSKTGVTNYIDDDLASITSHFTNTSFYMINCNAVDELLKILPLKFQIDLEIGMKIKTHNCKLYLLKNTGVTNYNHKSDSQYYFLTFNELFNIFSFNLPEEIINKIYNYLPTKESILKKSNYEYNFGYNLNNYYGYSYGYDYPVNINPLYGPAH